LDYEHSHPRMHQDQASQIANVNSGHDEDKLKHRNADMTTTRPVYVNEGWTPEGLVRKNWAQDNRKCAWCSGSLPKGRRLYCSRKCGLRFIEDPRYHNTMLLWTRIRAEVLWETKLCQKCKVKPSSEVDHIREIALGGDPFDKANLQALCRQCHKEKTVCFLVEEMGKKGRIGKRLARTRVRKHRWQLETDRRPYGGAPVEEFFAIAEQSSIEDF